MFYPELIGRYCGIVLARYPRAEPHCQPDYPTSAPHLLWMLNELQTSSTMSLTKKHRWLGYIQGILVSNGWITVQEERDLTRDIFNGE